MGIFDKPFKVNDTRVAVLRLTSEEAFIAIIFSAMLADEEIRPEELHQLNFILSRFKGLATLTPVQFQNLIVRFQKIIRKEGVGTLITAAKNTINKDMRDTAFANAVEVVLADGIVDPREKEFLEKLQQAVGITDETAEQIIHVIIIKNRGTTADIFEGTELDKMFYA
ncbi:MAG: tellurite resistance TerB family protein [Candidatus Heimdallarchaeota archaeon]